MRHGDKALTTIFTLPNCQVQVIVEYRLYSVLSKYNVKTVTLKPQREIN